MNQMEKIKLLADIDKAGTQIAANEDTISAALEALEKQDTDKARKLAWSVFKTSDFVLDRQAALLIMALAGPTDTYGCY